MNRSITIRWSTVVLGLLVAVALLAAYLLGGAGQPVAQAATTDEGSEGAARTLRLVGTGEVTAVPDQASFSLSVTVKRDRLEDALDRSSTTLRAVLRALAEHGIEGEDVQTTGLSMHPEYDYPNSGPPVLTGYRVTQRTQVRVTELRQAGRAVSTAVSTGGNAVRVGGIRLEVGDTEALVAEARDDAVADAMAKADQYAEATGQQLGPVVSLREVPASGRSPEAAPFPQDSAYMLADRAAAMPVRAGEDELSLRVEMVWSFE